MYFFQFLSAIPWALLLYCTFILYGHSSRQLTDIYKKLATPHLAEKNGQQRWRNIYVITPMFYKRLVCKQAMLNIFNKNKFKTDYINYKNFSRPCKMVDMYTMTNTSEGQFSLLTCTSRQVLHSCKPKAFVSPWMAILYERIHIF